MNFTIKEYLTTNHPDLNLRSIYGKFNLRFELGGEILRNGTIERVRQVVTRATEIYKQAIGNDELIMLIEEYENEFFTWKKEIKDICLNYYLSMS